MLPLLTVSVYVVNINREKWIEIVESKHEDEIEVWRCSCVNKERIYYGKKEQIDIDKTYKKEGGADKVSKEKVIAYTSERHYFGETYYIETVSFNKRSTVMYLCNRKEGIKKELGRILEPYTSQRFDNVIGAFLGRTDDPMKENFITFYQQYRRYERQLFSIA